MARLLLLVRFGADFDFWFRISDARRGSISRALSSRTTSSRCFGAFLFTSLKQDKKRERLISELSYNCVFFLNLYYISASKPTSSVQRNHRSAKNAFDTRALVSKDIIVV